MDGKSLSKQDDPFIESAVVLVGEGDPRISRRIRRRRLHRINSSFLCLRLLLGFRLLEKGGAATLQLQNHLWQFVERIPQSAAAGDKIAQRSYYCLLVVIVFVLLKKFSYSPPHKLVSDRLPILGQ